jgi:hypothetical protein
MFWRNILHAGFLFGLLFDPEVSGVVFLQNVSLVSTDYMALHARRLKELFVTNAVRTSNPVSNSFVHMNVSSDNID